MPYYPQNHPDMGFLRHLVLLYGRDKDTWDEAGFRAYAAYLDDSGKPLDWLFDSFLLCPMTAPSGNSFSPDVNVGTTMCGEGDFNAIPWPNPATRRDYDDLLDVYFGDGGYLESLNAAIAGLKGELPAPEHLHNVVLNVPYPGIVQALWGKLPGGGRSLNFATVGQNVARATADRLAATVWFAEEAAARWDAARFENLNFLGFYWPFESVYRGWDVDDHVLLKGFHAHLRAMGKKLMWIPFYATYNTHLLDNYQDYYFDLAFQQPNHMFYENTPGIEGPAMAAKARNAGFEMEYYLDLGEPTRVSAERHARFRDYLNGGAHFGFMRESACAWFHGQNGIAEMRTHPDPQERAFYHDIYRFIKGTYQPVE